MTRLGQDHREVLMKLIAAVIQDYDASDVLRALTDTGIRATLVASTGGFLKMGNATLLIGVDEQDVRRVLSILGSHCRERVEDVQPEVLGGMEEWLPPKIVKVSVGGATVSILNVERFEQLA